ncbi:hypothetical protein PC116_g1327 [Phytophthora cactorum]|uniref:Uncharacterized protein n=1 Tax=Phytophthora cactorum TaxID=29920 RepID=A0A8T1LTP1_9STRA|nr:hypothetical protein PC114_g14370 [Phytophthora cactorum]KAG2954374.1 hypothetical protein PC117_g1228 [Phytophthora cactorum]KAG2977271.1 hypothetical protein PC120_g25540 [Phytophthora cactorum]KAG3041355.1 hypothetical protein PC119_g736 [Phytophthora cactorum]KAG3156177.1 hypothetical protein C6341_g15160 [Phytophthora cactorum]
MIRIGAFSATAGTPWKRGLAPPQLPPARCEPLGQVGAVALHASVASWGLFQVSASVHSSGARENLSCRVGRLERLMG